MLFAHVLLSVGWVGLSATSLVLAVVTFGQSNTAIRRGVFEFVELLSVVLGRPAAIGALVTGLVLSFGTKWGLFRYYWVLIKFVLLIVMVAAAIVLTPGFVADGIAHAGQPGSAELATAQWGIVLLPIGHLVGLVVSTLLSVYKPGGRIRK
ncbi:hypothetical protein EV191_1054 [Tamaricihabitans halophyticus]|uniref:DUF2269 family protein n=1 Tax=Tamaricihabitans halophyticus TaxID=1262583 RepID=A0A4R2QSR4_9PSEU|nr:hypothetical protein EV191_1054 [Tamaricihabitans halophyticus]